MAKTTRNNDYAVEDAQSYVRDSETGVTLGTTQFDLRGLEPDLNDAVLTLTAPVIQASDVINHGKLIAICREMGLTERDVDNALCEFMDSINTAALARILNQRRIR